MAENSWKFSDCFANPKGKKVIIERENGRGGIEGLRRERKVEDGRKQLALVSSMKGPPEVSGHDFKVRPGGMVG